VSIEKKNKDHIRKHRGVALVAPALPKGDDPLQFWTNHATENTFVDLHCFANGEFDNPRPSGGGDWPGGYTGRATLIAELAPAIEARCLMRGQRTVQSLLSDLRAWWRLFDAVEAETIPDGRRIAKVTSIADLGPYHETAGHKQRLRAQTFNSFIALVNAERVLRRLPLLGWIAPGNTDPIRHLIPDDQTREIKISIKQDWERVRKLWALNDKVRVEAELRSRGEPPAQLIDDEAHRLKNLQYLQEIQKKTRLILPSGQQLLGAWKNEGPLVRRGLSRSLMRSIAFPTVEEADVAFHMALLNSGWNPSTMMRINATNPFLVANHPKDNGQLVLTTEADDRQSGEDGEVTLHANKPRAGGRTQFCTGRKSQPSSAPMVVQAYLQRVVPLREILRQEYQIAQTEFDRLLLAGADNRRLATQLKHVQKLATGCHSVWLYVDREGGVNWLHASAGWNRYGRKSDRGKKYCSYLDLVRERLNRQRAEMDRSLIPKITPADFRDVYARWVFNASNGSILAVMLALGHKHLSSTSKYLENNIFSAENDDIVRRWGDHLFTEMGRGRIDLTILAQLVRHGPLTPAMEARLTEYRRLKRSRVGVGCADPWQPPPEVAPNHIAGRLCGKHRCLKECRNARFLPESLEGIAMRAEELLVMLEHLPRETWLNGGFDEELHLSELLLQEMFSSDAVADARDRWRKRIELGEHVIPGLGCTATTPEAA
jgi:hypothetical protein